MLARGVLAVLLSSGVAFTALAETAPDVTRKASETAAVLRRHMDLLASNDPATRLATFHEMIKSGNPMLAEAAIGAGLRSDDSALRSLALRGAFRQVRSMVAKLEPPVPATVESQAVVQACGNSVQYTIEKYSYDTAAFEVRGQDNAGVGNVSGATISLTIEYGCSFSGTLQKDGTVQGIVSAPYKKGALPARMVLR